MDTDRAVALLKERLAELEPLQEPDAQFEAWKRKSERTLRRTLGDDHELVKNFEGVTWRADMLPGIYGKDEGVGILKAAIFEIEELSEPPDLASSAAIDPDLWEHVRRLVESEQWAQVTSQTAIFVESKVRQWSGLPDSKYGKDLMVAVLRPREGLFPLGRTPGEHEGWLALGIGITMAVGNADRHRIRKLSRPVRHLAVSLFV
jgi:Protein of unknown function (Hypoth_ymh)